MRKGPNYRGGVTLSGSVGKCGREERRQDSRLFA